MRNQDSLQELGLQVEEAWRLLIQSAGSLEGVQPFLHDLVDVGRQVGNAGSMAPAAMQGSCASALCTSFGMLSASACMSAYIAS